MRKRRQLMAVAALGLVGLAIGWYFFRPDRLFTNRTVDEAFPVVASGPSPTLAPTPAPTLAPTMSAMDEPMDGAETAMPAPSATVAPMPATAAPTAQPEPVALSAGTFHPVTHEGQGTATIYQLPDGKRVLRLTDFRVLDGPDLYVYLIAAPDAEDDATVADGAFVSLGEIKGNQGNQNYEIPADVDLGQYHAVTIWCKRFGVNFATAPLGMV